MYIEKGKEINYSEVKKYLEENYMKQAKKLVKESSYDTIESIFDYSARELISFNHALHCGHEVWAECTKYPKGYLETGRHWYQIYYLEIENNKPVKRHFWPLLLMDKARTQHSFGYGFSSGAIGMSRLLDATDCVFNILKRLGGHYCQLS